MFAVSGWSVTAPLKTQIDNKRDAQTSTQIPTRPSQSDGITKKSRSPKPLKRKRGRETQAENVNGDNVEGLWHRVIEGRKPKRIRKEKIKGNIKDPQNGISKEKDDNANSNKAAGSAGKTLQGESKKKKQKKPKTKAMDNASTESTQASTSSSIIHPQIKLTPLQASMRAKLSSARFRHLNEQLYTTPSSTALSLFKETPELFNEYHSGFRQQVEVWPENPVDGYIKEVRSRGALRRFNANAVTKDSSTWNSTPLPRSRNVCTIADIGCGDARLASTLQSKSQKLNLKILSFDLYSPSPLVTTADAANLPIVNGTVDIAVFCLALMGTNWLDFIDESWRILRPNGELWIAEIKSRFARGSTSTSSSAVGTKTQQSTSKRGSGYTKGGIGTVRSDVPSLSKKDRERQQAEDEAELAAKIDVPDALGGGAAAAAAAAASGALAALSSSEKTDISAFVIALRRRGFALAGNDRDAVDMSNKMFVKMRFTKAAQPVTGKNADLLNDANGDDDTALRAADQQVDFSRGGRRFGDRLPKKKQMKFLENVGTPTDQDESRILKPCVYKLR